MGQKSRGQSKKWSRSTLILIVGGLLGLIIALSVAVSYNSFNGNSKTPSQKSSSGHAQRGKSTKSEPITKHLSNQSSRDAKFADHGTYQLIGNKTYHPSHGIFPKGCKWRPVTEEGKEGYDYVFWDFSSKTWTSEKPAACSPTGYPKPGPPPPWTFNKRTPRTEVTCSNDHCMYNNLFYNRGRWYALVDGPDHVPTWRFSRNQEIVTLHVADVWGFLDSVKWNVIPGDTILFDFIYFTHPTAIGHWWEMLGPMYSILQNTTFKRPCDQLILLHLHRRHVLEWVRAMMAVALGVGLEDPLPPLLVQEATVNVHDQISEWLVD